MLIIKSNNHNLSFLLAKNPMTGIQSRKVRGGNAVFWFTNAVKATEWNCVFIDGVNRASFSEQNYLDKGCYAAPMMYYNLISTVLKTAVTDPSEYESESGEFEYEVKLNHFMCLKDKFILEQAPKYLGTKMRVVQIDKYENIYNVTLTGNNLQNVLRSVLLLCLLSLTNSEKKPRITEDLMDKILTIFDNKAIPYFGRYLFARNYITSIEQFKQHGQRLNTETIELKQGDTWYQRYAVISKLLKQDDELLKHPLIDVGCGEGRYAMRLAPDMLHTYHAIDKDEDLIEGVTAKANARGLNIKASTTFNEVDLYGSCNILCTEVLEHMPLDESRELLVDLLSRPFRKFIVTVPNHSFNKNYGMKKGEFRHDDHDWEMSKEEFHSWIKGVVFAGSKPVEFEFFDIGDVVDGEPCSLGVVFTKPVKPQAVITVGISASGKSTLAKKFVEKLGYTEINRDAIRFRGKTPDWSKYEFTASNEHKVTKKWQKQFSNAMKNFENIIISDTNLNYGAAQELKYNLEKNGYSAHIKYLEVPLEEAIRRNNSRAGGVPQEVLVSQYKRFMQNVYGVKPYIPPKDLNAVDTYLCDLDGTVFDKGNRSPYDYLAAIDDKPIPHVVRIIKALIEDQVNVVFFTARENVSGAMDVIKQTLQQHVLPSGVDIENFTIVIRDEGDQRPDYQVKMEMFETYVKNDPNIRVLGVFDDRKQVIESCWNVLEVPVINVGKVDERF